MSRATSKRQVTLKAIAEQYGIQPGDEIRWVPAGDSIRVIFGDPGVAQPARRQRLVLSDQATTRQQARERMQRERVPVETR